MPEEPTGVIEELSENSLKIFEKIKAYYPPDHWGRPQWKPEGIVFDNGWRDLRQKEVRDERLKWYENLIGGTVITFAEAEVRDTGKFTRAAFHFDMAKKWIELALLIRELDFQIMTMDIVEG